MDYTLTLCVVFAVTGGVLSNTPLAFPSTTVQPPASNSYIPHSTYGYSDTYGSGIEQRYRDSPMDPYSEPPQGTALRILQTSLRIFAKVGLFLAAGAVLIIVGTFFTAAICSVTPICTLTFNGFSVIDRETVRSFMSPDRISATAALVQDAIGKYQRLQRAVNGS